MLLSPPNMSGTMWSAVLAPALPHSAQMVALPSLSIWRLLALYVGSLYGDVMWLMLLAPLATPAVAFERVPVLGVCVPHSSKQVALGCRTQG